MPWRGVSRAAESNGDGFREDRRPRERRLLATHSYFGAPAEARGFGSAGASSHLTRWSLLNHRRGAAWASRGVMPTRFLAGAASIPSAPASLLAGQGRTLRELAAAVGVSHETVRAVIQAKKKAQRV